MKRHIQVENLSISLYRTVPPKKSCCVRFNSESTGLEGVVEVTYVSLKSIYSITDTYQFQLPQAHAECICDCPGGN